MIQGRSNVPLWTQELILHSIVEIHPHRAEGRGYLVPASLHAFHGKVDRHIHPGGDSYIIFPTLLDAERAIREAGFEPSLQQGARSFPDRRVVLPKRDD